MAKKPSIDGFVPRRSANLIGGALHGEQRAIASDNYGLKRRDIVEGKLHSNDGAAGLVKSEHGISPQSLGIRRSDVDDSLREIDIQERAAQTPKRGSFMSRRKQLLRFMMLAFVLSIIVVTGWVGVKTLLASNSVFKGDIFGLIQHKELRKDQKGRTNIIVVGTSEDDPGHQGANLTDSIMVLSVDQKNKNAYMVSIPRDLEVKYGMACTPGYAGKINAFFSCVDAVDTPQAEDKRQTAMRSFVGTILGIEIQYSAHVNYSVMRDLVGALGTITVDIQGSGGAPGVMDSNFDWKCRGGQPYASLATMKKNCPPNGHFIDYPNGKHELDVEHALYLAMARGDAEPTYGLGNSNFDREQNQQKIIMAIREKALSSGTLANPAKVAGIIDAIGSNLRTNFETSEIRTLAELAKDIPSASIQRINLLDEKIMTAAAQPAAGVYNYTQLRAYLQKKLYATGISKEAAHVVVLNASGVAGAAQREADRLSELGLTIDAVGNAPEGNYPANTILQLDVEQQQPLTVAKLKSIYGVETKVTTDPLIDVADTTDFVIVIVTPTTSVDEDTTNN